MSTAASRIASISTTALCFPLSPPFRAAIRLIDSVDVVLVRIRDDQGVEGAGVAFAFGAADALPVLHIARSLGDTRIGMETLAIERHWREMHQLLAIAGPTGVALAALSAIDMALWDLAGKCLGKPLWQLLGGAREKTNAYASGGSLSLSIDALCREAEGFVAKGHTAIKIKAGHGIEGDRERILAVRDAVGAKVSIAVDGNQQWSAKGAIRWARAMDDCELRWLEEPVRADDFYGHAQVRSAISMDLATGENLFGVAAAGRAISERSCDILMPNLQRVGGITGWRKIAAAAEIAGIEMAGHVYPELNVHLMCATPNASGVELWPGWPSIWQGSLDIIKGEVAAPTGPGLGLPIDEALVQAHMSARG